MRAFLTSIFLLGLLPVAVHAAPAEKLKVEESVEINARADNVWTFVSNFGDMAVWHPAVKSTQIQSGTPNLPGAVRLLILQDGGIVQEELVSYSPEQKTFGYKILGGVLPVSSYQSTLTVKATSETKTKVTWKGDFKRKDTSDKPVANQTDADAVNTITMVYQSGLENLKKIAEGR
jgi:mxaD protein